MENNYFFFPTQFSILVIHSSVGQCLCINYQIISEPTFLEFAMFAFLIFFRRDKDQKAGPLGGFIFTGYLLVSYYKGLHVLLQKGSNTDAVCTEILKPWCLHRCLQGSCDFH